MARVNGIISAGLQSAVNGQTIAKRSASNLSNAEQMAAETREKAKQRSQRSSATAESGSGTDTLKSLLAGGGAGFVFGPVAGLLTAGVAKLIQNKRREGLAAYRDQAAQTSEEFLARSDSALREFETNATTDSEVAEAKMMRAEFDQLSALSRHPNPEVAGTAVLRAQELTGTLDNALDDWQSERLATEQVNRDRFNTEATRAEGIRDDVFREGASFGVRQDAYERMLAVEDSPAGDQVLLVNAFKMVDPNSAVLPGEAATAANTAGVPDFLVTAYNRVLRDGERLDPDQRADLVRQAGIQYQVARSDQIDRNTAATGRARDFGIRDQLIPHLTMPVKGMEELPFPTGALRDETSRRALSGPAPRDDLSGAIGGGDASTLTTTQPQADTFGTGAGVAAEVAGTEFGDLFSDVMVGFRGGRKFTGEDGQPYVEYPDGHIERGRTDTRSFASPFDMAEANQEAKDKADDMAHNARIRRERIASGADPETGVFPINRRETNE